MIAVVQRVSRAEVVDGAAVRRIGRSLMVLFCAEKGDLDADLDSFPTGATCVFADNAVT